jgi:hypothetical protein
MISGDDRFVSNPYVFSMRGWKTPPILIDKVFVTDSWDILVPIGLRFD